MLDIALDRFPVHHSLTSGAECLIRPLHPEDEASFQTFYSAIPEKERFLIKHRFSNEHQIHEWCQTLDYEKNLPLLALVNDQIVGYATLQQRPGGWKRHIAMVGALVHPDFRGLGVLRALLGEIIDVARNCGLTKLEAEFNGERKNTLQSFARCGFSDLVRLPDYLLDMTGLPHDYVVMGLNLTPDFEYAGAGD